MPWGKPKGKLRIHLRAGTREELDSRIKEKLSQGYTLINRGELIQYYRTLYYAVVEIE